MKKAILMTATVFCALVLLAGCGGSDDTYQAGTYTAMAQGYVGDVTVEVEFDKDFILSIEVTSQTETVGFGDRAAESLPDTMLEAQTWDVDAVTSATVTSDAIKAAVKDCIEQAKNK